MNIVFFADSSSIALPDTRQHLLDPMASYDDGRTEGILPQVGRKRSRPEAWELVNPVVHKFKLFHPGYDQWHEENILRLHADKTCTTAKAPGTHHGSWMFTENNDLRVRWHSSGDSSTIKDHMYRKIEKTESWGLVKSGKAWYSMLIPVLSAD